MAAAPESKNQLQSAVNCDTCENVAVHLCRTCRDRLCDACKKVHSKSKGTFDHEVVLLTCETLTSTLENPLQHVCKWHPKCKADVGCQKCEVPLCKKL